MIIVNNHTDDYALVLEDRTEVKQEEKVGKLSVVTDINKKKRQAKDCSSRRSSAK